MACILNGSNQLSGAGDTSTYILSSIPKMNPAITLARAPLPFILLNKIPSTKTAENGGAKKAYKVCVYTNRLLLLLAIKSDEDGDDHNHHGAPSPNGNITTFRCVFVYHALVYIYRENGRG